MGAFGAPSLKAENLESLAVTLLPVGGVGAVVTGIYHLGEANHLSVKQNKDATEDEDEFIHKITQRPMVLIEFAYKDESQGEGVLTHVMLERDHQHSSSPLGMILKACNNNEAITVNYDIKDAIGSQIFVETENNPKSKRGAEKAAVVAGAEPYSESDHSDYELPSLDELTGNYLTFDQIEEFMKTDEGKKTLFKGLPAMAGWFLKFPNITFGAEAEIKEKSQDEMADLHATYSKKR